MMLGRLFLIHLFVLAGAGKLLAQETASEPADIQVLDAKWGFDGFSRYKTFVPLRIVMKNRGPQKTLRVQLTRADALNDQGEVLEQEVTLSPDTTRVIVLSPFVSDPGETWTLRWGQGEEDSLPIKGQSADDGIVYIASTTDLIHRTGSLPVMQEDEFPTSVTALDALRVVFLDQEPRWPGARRKAFQEWLLKGGKVVVLNLPDGSTPKFANGFEYLNVTKPSTPYGSGTIQRLPLSPQEITQKVLETTILGRPLTGGDLTQKLAAYDANRWNNYRHPGVTTQGIPIPILNYSRDSVLTELKDLAGTRQRWGLIYLTVFAYVGWQWRNGWRWGLMEKQPGRFYAGLVGLSLGFSLLFFIFGRAGAAGEDRVRSVMIARQITKGLYDVEGWSVVATGLSGGEHAFSVPGSGQLYGGTESFGQNPMWIREGSLTTDLSAFSSQKLAFRTRVEMPDIPLRLDTISLDQMQSKSAKIGIDPSYKSPVYAAVIVIDNQVFEFTRKTGELKPTENWGHSMHEWISPYTVRNAKRMQWRTGLLGWLFDFRTTEDIYTEAFVGSVGNGFSVGPMVFPDSFSLPKGYARVMLYTDLPKELQLSGDFPDQGGRMLYVADVPLSGGK